jgi:hypothetical protein
MSAAFILVGYGGINRFQRKRHGFLPRRFGRMDMEQVMPGHDVIFGVGGEMPGGARGCRQRSKVSMMTICPPQQGAWWSQIDGLFKHSLVGRRGNLEQCTCTRELGFARRAGQQAIVPDAVEAAGQETWVRNRRINASVASVITFWRSGPSRR